MATQLKLNVIKCTKMHIFSESQNHKGGEEITGVAFNLEGHVYI